MADLHITSGLPINVDNETGELQLGEDLLCDTVESRTLGILSMSWRIPNQWTTGKPKSPTASIAMSGPKPMRPMSPHRGCATT